VLYLSFTFQLSSIWYVFHFVHDPQVDIVLLMSVNPGFGGQAFIPETLNKLGEARKLIDESGTCLCVDSLPI